MGKKTKEQQIKEYTAVSPAFMTMGVAFFIIGLNNLPSLIGVGIVFLILSVIFYLQGEQLKKKEKLNPEQSVDEDTNSQS